MLALEQPQGSSPEVQAGPPPLAPTKPSLRLRPAGQTAQAPQLPLDAQEATQHTIAPQLPPDVQGVVHGAADAPHVAAQPAVLEGLADPSERASTGTEQNGGSSGVGQGSNYDKIGMGSEGGRRGQGGPVEGKVERKKGITEVEEGKAEGEAEVEEEGAAVRVMHADFLWALAQLKPSLSLADLAKYERMRDEYESK